MTKDEAPDWVPNRAFLDACASLGLEKPPSLLTDTPAYEPPRPREPEEPEPDPEPVRASDAFGGVRAMLEATDPVERAVTAARAAKQRANAALKAGDAALARKRYLAALCALDEVAGRARPGRIARQGVGRAAAAGAGAPRGVAARPGAAPGGAASAASS